MINFRTVHALKKGLQKPEFGDTKQIKALQDFEAYENDLKQGIPTSFFYMSFRLSVEITCPKCLVSRNYSEIYAKYKNNSDDALVLTFEPQTCYCEYCDQPYILSPSTFKMLGGIDEI